MDGRIFWGILFIILVVIGVWYVRRPSGGTPAAKTPSPQLSADLYPLYGGVTWQSPEPEGFVIGTTSYSGASIASNPVTNTMNPSEVFTPFESYYDAKLKGAGWAVDNALAAGGPVGGQTAYQKGSDLILVRFGILYHVVSSSSPSECPCDVTLSLFSGK